MYIKFLLKKYVNKQPNIINEYNDLSNLYPELNGKKETLRKSFFNVDVYKLS